MSDTPLVLVTGVSGFIASWVAYCALKLGYRVRGTVRSLANEKKVAHLRNLCPGSRYEMELVEANLTSEKGWDEAVHGCTYILHVASPFPIADPKSKDELVVPAVEGTLHVLRAASRMETPPRRVVVTSSTAAIAFGQAFADREFTDNDWTQLDNPDWPIGAYVESKTRAEKAAWDFVASLPENKRFELATVNPTLVQGPMLSGNECSSADIPRQILLGEMPGLPDLSLDLVHVYDVAKAHMLAMTLPEAAGKRFMVHGCQLSIREVAAILTSEFAQHGYHPTSFHIPAWVVNFMACFDAQARSISKIQGTVRELNPVNAKTVLGMKLRDSPRDLVLEMTYAAIYAGIIPDKSNDKTLSKNYTQPEIDLSDIPKPN